MKSSKLNNNGLENAIIANIIAIRTTKLKMKQATVAMEIGVDASVYSKIESGQLNLSVDKLAKIADCFKMSIIDIITYPKEYVDRATIYDERTARNGQSRAILQLELDTDKKEQVFKVVFGEHNSEMLKSIL